MEPDDKPDFAALERNVIAWAMEREILARSTPAAQLLKTVSELGELADATLKDDWKAGQDGIGDVLVTLIIHATMRGMNLRDCLQAAWEEIKDRRGCLTAEGVFVKAKEGGR